MTGHIILALDAGGSYSKATAFDLVSGHFATEGEAVPVIAERGWQERDPEVLWQSVVSCTRRLLARLDVEPNEFLAVGVTGHGNGAYLVDQNGRPSRNAILATDTRAADMVHQWIVDGAEEDLREYAWNGLWAGMTGPLLAWLAIHEPEVLERSHFVLGAKDYLRGRLTGLVAVEMSQASACGLYDNSVLTRSTGLTRLEAGRLALQVYGLDRWQRLVPPTVSSMSLYEVSAQAAGELGLRAGVPVVAGMVDNPAAQHGSGVFDSGAICVGAGTWSINQFLIPVAEMRCDSTLGRVKPYSATAALNSQGLLCEASPTSASTLSWAMDRAVTAMASTDRAAGRDPYASRLECEGHRPKRADDPIFLPFINGSRSDARARGAWIGLASSTGEDELLGAVLEGICMEHRRHIERLESAVHRRLPVRLSGGPTKSPQWCQLFADVLCRPVEVSPVAELGSLAVAAMAAAAVGQFRSVEEGVSALGRDLRTFSPQTARADSVELRWQLYQEWATRLDEVAWSRDQTGAAS